MARSDQLKRAALVAFVGIGLIALPTYVTGNAAAEGLCVARPNEPCADPAISRVLIERHEGAAVLSLMVMLVTAASPGSGCGSTAGTRQLAVWNTVAVLLLSLIAMGLVARAASIGGEIRHPEVRVEQVPVTPEPTLARTIAGYVNERTVDVDFSETLHFIGLSLLVGIVLLIDLRALGCHAGGALRGARAAVAVGGDRLRCEHRDGHAVLRRPARVLYGEPCLLLEAALRPPGQREHALLLLRRRLDVGAREGRSSLHEGRRRVGAGAVGRRHVLGQHAALHRQFVLNLVVVSGFSGDRMAFLRLAAATPVQRLAQ